MGLGGAQLDVGGAAVGRPARPRRLSVAALAPWAGALAGSLLVGVPALDAPSVGLDEDALVTYGTLVLHGDVLHRDVFTPYGPGIFWLLAGVFAVTGPSFVGERVVGLCLHVLLAAGVGRAVAVGRARQALAALVSALCLAPLGLVSSAWVAGLAATVWSLVLAARRPATAGGLVALAMLFRPELVIPATAAHLVRGRRAGRGWWARWLVALAVGSIPFVVHVVLSEGLAVADLLGRLTAQGVRTPLSAVDVGSQIVVLLVLLSVLLPAVVAVRRRDEHLAVASVLAAGLLPQLFQRPDIYHAAYTACLSVPLALVALERLLPRAGAVGGVLVAALLAAALVPVTWAAPGATWVAVGDREYPAQDEGEAAAISGVVGAVTGASDPGERLFAGNPGLDRAGVWATYLYWLVPDRAPASRFLESAPGYSERPGSGLLDDARSADVVVLHPMSERHRSRLYPELRPGDPALREAFGGMDEVARVGEIRVLVRR